MAEYLKQAPERMHYCQAPFLEDVLVVQKFGAKIIWQGVGGFFLIKIYLQADKCYAWSSSIKGSTKRRYYAVLHIPPIDSTQKAVRTSIIYYHNKGSGKSKSPFKT